MKLEFLIKDKFAHISFIPFDIIDLDNVVGEFEVKDIDRFNISFFKEEDGECIDEHFNLDNYKEKFSEIKYISDITKFLKETPEEDYSVYKLNIYFERFELFFDDDSYLAIGGKISSKEDYKFFHDLYVKIYDIYMKSGYLLDSW